VENNLTKRDGKGKGGEEARGKDSGFDRNRERREGQRGTIYEGGGGLRGRVENVNSSPSRENQEGGFAVG